MVEVGFICYLSLSIDVFFVYRCVCVCVCVCVHVCVFAMAFSQQGRTRSLMCVVHL